MKTSTTLQLNPEQQQQIRAAVEKAEANTSGEIVPLIIPAAASYLDATIRVSALAVMLITLLALGLWPSLPLWGSAAIMATSYLASGVILSLLPALRRRLIGAERMNNTVNDRAYALFIQHGLHYTREATGVLILVSLFEKRVQILADRGINEQVSRDQWQKAVDTIIDGLHHDNMVPALCEAIDQCGTLLAQHCPRRHDDTNELPDLIVH